jgi:HSP20 family molecular chaperone IbpA
MTQPENGGEKSSLSSTRPRIITCEGLGALEEDIQRAIAYRAYELYESRGRNHGRDMEDWFSAEKELIKPANVQIADSGGQLSVRAGVAGFNARNIQLGVSQRRLIIWGEAANPGVTRGTIHMLGEINLPVEVDPRKAVARVSDEVLEFRAPREKSGAA